MALESLPPQVQGLQLVNTLP